MKEQKGLSGCSGLFCPNIYLHDHYTVEEKMKSFDPNKGPFALGKITQVPNHRKMIEDYILEFQDELLKDVYIFDYFHNEKNSEIKIGFRFVFQSPDSTITEFQVNDIISDIISYTQKIKGINLPGLK